ncbi:MAG: hypothetical protein GY847_09880 [Proteobacteria bacterium]|nr:hypothetical protein [Pseudomonadota bacterium]
MGLAKSALHIERASAQEIIRRLDTCRECKEATRSKNPKFKKNNGLTNLSRCRICKCFVVPKTKVSSEACPLDKW